VPELPAAPRWHGWARTGGVRSRWRLLVEGAATEAEAMDRLRNAVAGERHVDLCVLPEGRRPAERRFRL
jgi:hypothetical protein